MTGQANYDPLPFTKVNRGSPPFESWPTLCFECRPLLASVQAGDGPSAERSGSVSPGSRISSPQRDCFDRLVDYGPAWRAFELSPSRRDERSENEKTRPGQRGTLTLWKMN